MSKISVLVPVFPGQNLEPTLEGMEGQTFRDVQVVVLQQVPDEDLAPEVRGRLQQLPDAVVIRDRYRNMAGLMNRGFAESSGELVVYLPPNIRLRASLWSIQPAAYPWAT